MQLMIPPTAAGNTPRHTGPARHAGRLRDLAEDFELEALARLSPELALREARALLGHLAGQHATLLRSVNAPAERQAAAQPYVALNCSDEGGYSLQLFVWPAGASTQIHDHSSWGAFSAVTGELREERFVRLDDATRPNYAHIRGSWRRHWRRDDGASILMPADGGIHRVSNPGSRAVVSVHLYGPPSQIDGRDYDPLRDYVCDRFEDDALV